MRVKFTLIGAERLKTLISLVQLFSKHGATLYFVFKEDTLNILLNQANPLLWVEINMKLFTESYEFISGDEESDEIYMEFKIKDLLMGLRFFQKDDAEQAVLKLVKDKYPQFRISSTPSSGVGMTSKYRTDIPVIIVPKEVYETIPLPNELQFSKVIKPPRYGILKKYIDIFKNFKSLKFTFREKTMTLESNEVGSQVTTTFDISYLDNDTVKFLMEVTVDAKKLALFFSSVGLLHTLKIINFHISANHRKNMKIYFQNADNSLSFHYVVASRVNDDDGDDDEIGNSENIE